jgi:Iron-sulfur cluster binding domain of dihydroorotate dehydrogenase B
MLVKRRDLMWTLIADRGQGTRLAAMRMLPGQPYRLMHAHSLRGPASRSMKCSLRRSPRHARIETLLLWADSLYLALDFESLPHILNALRRGLMRLRKGFAQAIVLPDLLPCGVGACDPCTIVTREGYRRVCRDGLVFDLLTLH